MDIIVTMMSTGEDFKPWSFPSCQEQIEAEVAQPCEREILPEPKGYHKLGGEMHRGVQALSS